MSTMTAIANQSSYSFANVRAHAFELLDDNVVHFEGDVEQVRDTIHEIADNVVPHYYVDILACLMSDDCDLDFEDSCYIPDTKSLTGIMQARIYEQVVMELSNEVDEKCEEWLEAHAQDEEDEEDAE